MAPPLIDLTGRIFGRLMVLKRDHKSPPRSTKWICQCDCGVIKSMYGSNLRDAKSCGCQGREAVSNAVLVDLTGQRFGLWTVLRRANGIRRPGGNAYWNCQCDCGTIRNINGSLLRRGHTKSCRCSFKTKPPNPLIDLTGQKFGRLLVLKRAPNQRPTATLWECMCDCGNTRFANGFGLRKGEIKSCGCQSMSGFKYDEPSIFYYIKINNLIGHPLYKIGITNRSVESRYRNERNEFETILEAKFSKGINAWKLEQALKRAFAKYAYTGESILDSGGDSELFTRDILNLDVEGVNPHPQKENFI